jgi:hypothetical protein
MGAVASSHPKSEKTWGHAEYGLSRQGKIDRGVRSRGWWAQLSISNRGISDIRQSAGAWAIMVRVSSLDKLTGWCYSECEKNQTAVSNSLFRDSHHHHAFSHISSSHLHIFHPRPNIFITPRAEMYHSARVFTQHHNLPAAAAIPRTAN